MAKQEDKKIREGRLETSEEFNLRKMAKSNADKIRQRDSEKVRVALMSDDVEDPGIPKFGDNKGEQVYKPEEVREIRDKQKALLSDVLEAIAKPQIISEIAKAFDKADLGYDMYRFFHAYREEVEKKIYNEMAKQLSVGDSSDPVHGLSAALKLYYFAVTFNLLGNYEDELRDAWIKGFCVALKKGDLQAVKDMTTQVSAIIVVPRSQWSSPVHRAFEEGLKTKEEGSDDYKEFKKWGLENGMNVYRYDM